MDGWRYFQIGADVWRLSSRDVEFQDRDGDWQPSIMPREMFLDDAEDFGRELFGDEISQAVISHG